LNKMIEDMCQGKEVYDKEELEQISIINARLSFST
jgi:hypothetical protein